MIMKTAIIMSVVYALFVISMMAKKSTNNDVATGFNWVQTTLSESVLIEYLKEGTRGIVERFSYGDGKLLANHYEYKLLDYGDKPYKKPILLVWFKNGNPLKIDKKSGIDSFLELVVKNVESFQATSDGAGISGGRILKGNSFEVEFEKIIGSTPQENKWIARRVED